ncbi:hypothetical protein PPBDW_I21015 [Photobacterium kishitanii]|nr:hypothetical protein PPBDW_I21015 [Photobacterium kishitanii]
MSLCYQKYEHFYDSIVIYLLDYKLKKHSLYANTTIYSQVVTNKAFKK